jgi:tetratricopeptide (TPR) repeat protein
MESNGVQHVNLAYFGAADPAYYGMSVTHLPGAPFFASDQIARPRVPGHVAISATVLAGATVEEGWRLFYRPFQALDPVATIGYSIHVYRVDRWPVASLATSGPAAERDVAVAGALALLLDKLGWTEEAIAYYRLYVERHPEDVSALANLGIKLLASGNVAEGVEMFRRAVAADPNDGAARRNLANALADLGQAAEAAPHAERAADLRPGDAGAFTLLGRVRAMQGRFPEAAAALQRALQLAPGDPEASAYLARLRELGR